MSKKRLVFATGNQGKVNEFRQMLGDEYEILSMKDLGVDVDIVEDGTTFEEMLLLKRRQLWRPPEKWCWQMIPVLRWII